MTFRTTSNPYGDAGSETVHESAGRDSLMVGHYPDRTEGQTTHFVRLSGKREQGMWWPSQMHGAEKAFLGYTDYGPPPSPELQALIAAHHTNHAWAPLLDKLAEEYPEKFEDVVAHHTAARYS